MMDLAPEADAFAVITAAIKRNNDAANELEARAGTLENEAGEARKRAGEYREASASLETALKSDEKIAPKTAQKPASKKPRADAITWVNK